jgi:hypothetical protein
MLSAILSLAFGSLLIMKLMPRSLVQKRWALSIKCSASIGAVIFLHHPGLRELAKNNSLTTFAIAIMANVEITKDLKFMIKGTTFCDMEKHAAARPMGVKI